jgi:hypothetical protein
MSSGSVVRPFGRDDDDPRRPALVADRDLHVRRWLLVLLTRPEVLDVPAIGQHLLRHGGIQGDGEIAVALPVVLTFPSGEVAEKDPRVLDCDRSFDLLYHFHFSIPR